MWNGHKKTPTRRLGLAGVLVIKRAGCFNATPCGSGMTSQGRAGLASCVALSRASGHLWMEFLRLAHKAGNLWGHSVEVIHRNGGQPAADAPRLHVIDFVEVELIRQWPGRPSSEAS